MLQGWWCYRGSTARNRCLMKTANICFASGMFKMDDRSRKNWGWICCAEVSKAPAMPGCYEHSEHLVHEHLFWVLCLLGQHWNCCSRDWELLRLLQKKKKNQWLYCTFVWVTSVSPGTEPAAHLGTPDKGLCCCFKSLRSWKLFQRNPGVAFLAVVGRIIPKVI